MDPRWTTLHIPQLHCPHELGTIRAGLGGDAGIVALEADYLTRELRIAYDPQQWTPARLKQQMDSLGFESEIARRSQPALNPPTAPPPESGTSLTKMVLANPSVTSRNFV